MKLSELTAMIEDRERDQAPGSETVLWGLYVERMRQLTGHLPVGDYPDVEIDELEAAWWLGAYVMQAAGMDMDDIVARRS